MEVVMWFKAYLEEYQFFPVINLSDEEERKIFDNKLTLKEAKIYFFIQSKAKFKNVRFLKNEEKLNCKIINESNEVYSFSIKHSFPTRILTPPSNKFSKLINKIFMNNISSILEINTNNPNKPTFIHLFQVVNGAKNVNLPKNFLKSEIVYLGKSDNAKGILHGRVYRHEKTLPILGKLGVLNDEILIFVFKINLVDEAKNLPNDIYIPVVEEILIRYFQPRENREYLTTKTATSKHWKKMQNLGFTDYCIEMNFDDDVCCFGTSKKEFRTKHLILGKF